MHIGKEKKFNMNFIGYIPYDSNHLTLCKRQDYEEVKRPVATGLSGEEERAE